MRRRSLVSHPRGEWERGRICALMRFLFRGFVRSVQGDINILEDLTGSDAENAVGVFDEVAALRAAALKAENVGAREAGSWALGFYHAPVALPTRCASCFP